MTRGSRRCPEDWAPSADLIASMRAETRGLDLATELAKMRDHEFRSPRKDWDAVWRNWMRSAAAWQRARPRGDRIDRQLSLAAALTRQDEPAVCGRKKMGEYNMLRCVSRLGHDGDCCFVVADVERVEARRIAP